MVALGANPGNLANNLVKLRSSDGQMLVWQIDVAAPQLQQLRGLLTCGFTAGYLPPLLHSESQGEPQKSASDSEYDYEDSRK
jgi:hypothetical protein